MTTSVPTPPRLHKAKAAAMTTAVLAATTALTIGLTSPAPPETFLAERPVVTAEVDLAAIPGLPTIGGVYGVGPVFWAAQLLGLTPEQVIRAAAGLAGGELAEAVGGLLDLLDQISPVEQGVKGPLPSDVFNAVNGLDYTATGVKDLITGAIGEVTAGLGLGFVGQIVNQLVTGVVDPIVGVAPVLNQRRAIIFSESLGGLTTSMAYRDMITAVQSGSDEWGDGVTGQWLIFLNNVSRPGGGIFALATPFTNPFGLNLTTPPAGSYTNEGADGKITKALNTSILDITWAYNLMADAPSTLNPLAWANAAAGTVFLTYLLPSDINDNNLAESLLLGGVGVADGLKVLLDLTGGQGLEMLPLWGDVVDGIRDFKLLGLPLPLLGAIPGLIADGLDDLADETKLPGRATYITYDSGNLPLLEPFRMIPRLVNTFVPGVYIPTPVTNTFEEALRMLVNTGYQDINPDTLEREFDSPHEQAYLWHSPLTPTQNLVVPRLVFNALIDGAQQHLFNPVAWTPRLPGVDFAPLVQNDVAMAVSALLIEALEAVRAAANPMFLAGEDALRNITPVFDDLNAQITAAIDSVLKVEEVTPDASDPPILKPADVLDPINPFSTTDSGAELKTVTVSEEVVDDEGVDAEAPVAESGVGTDFFGDTEGIDRAVKIADALNPRKALQAAAADANERVEKQVTKTQNSLRKANERAALVGDKLRDGDVAGAAKQVGANVQNRVERLKKDVDNGVNKLRGGDTTSNKKGAAAQSDKDSKDSNDKSKPAA